MHTLEIFLNHRPLFLSWGVDLGRRGYNAESSFSRGDTPPRLTQQAGTKRTRDDFFFSPATQRADTTSQRNQSLSYRPPPPNHRHLEIQTEKKKKRKTVKPFLHECGIEGP